MSRPSLALRIERIIPGDFEHDVGAGEIWPLRHPSSFPIVLEQGLHPGVDSFRREHGQQPEPGTKDVPDGVLGRLLLGFAASGTGR